MPLSKNMQIHDIMNSYLNNDKITLNLNNFKFRHRCLFHIAVFPLIFFFCCCCCFSASNSMRVLHFDFSNSFISFRFAFLYLSLVLIIIIVVHYNNKFAKWKSIQVYIYLLVIHLVTVCLMPLHKHTISYQKLEKKFIETRKQKQKIRKFYMVTANWINITHPNEICHRASLHKHI